MASERAVAMKHAQAAENSANALTQMAENTAAIQTEVMSLREQLDILQKTMEWLTPENVVIAIEEVAKRRNLVLTAPASTQPEPKKK